MDLGPKPPNNIFLKQRGKDPATLLKLIDFMFNQ